MKNLSKTLARFKVYADRAQSYASKIQLFIVVLAAAKYFNWSAYLAWYYIPFWFVLYILVLGFIGWVDTRLKIKENEQNHLSETNPAIREMKENIRHIRLNIDKL